MRIRWWINTFYLILHSESTQFSAWVVKIGPVTGDIYIYGYMIVSSVNYANFARIDSSYNIKYSTAFSGSSIIGAWEVDSTESKIYALIRPSTNFNMGIFNTTDGTSLQMYTTI